MTRSKRYVLAVCVLTTLGMAALTVDALGQQTGEHKLLAPKDITWGAAPPSVPAGAQAAVLYGDPGKEGMFAFRLKMPKDYHIAPHTHPKPEIVTVLSGTVRLGVGTSADRVSARVLPAGSFFALSPGMAHYLFVDDDAVLQLNASGPWGVAYVNPKDDPRQKTQ